MNNYKIFLRDESGELVETGQIEADTIQNAIVQINGNYDAIEKVEDGKNMRKIIGLCIAILVIVLIGATGYISYDTGYLDGYNSGYMHGQYESERKGNCATCDCFDSYIYQGGFHRDGILNWLSDDEYGKQMHIGYIGHYDYIFMKKFCENYGAGVCEVMDDSITIGGEEDERLYTYNWL